MKEKNGQEESVSYGKRKGYVKPKVLKVRLTPQYDVLNACSAGTPSVASGTCFPTTGSNCSN